MNSREGVNISRRYQLRLGEPLASELDAFARARDLCACPAIKLLVRQGLDAAKNRRGPESPAALAALVAAEHSLLVVAGILPQGRSLIASLAEEAFAAAEQRLALVDPVTEGAQP